MREIVPISRVAEVNAKIKIAVAIQKLSASLVVLSVLVENSVFGLENEAIFKKKLKDN